MKLEVFPWGISLWAESNLENDAMQKWFALYQQHPVTIFNGAKGNPDWNPYGWQEHLSIHFTKQTTLPEPPEPMFGSNLSEIRRFIAEAFKRIKESKAKQPPTTNS